MKNNHDIDNAHFDDDGVARLIQHDDPETAGSSIVLNVKHLAIGSVIAVTFFAPLGLLLAPWLQLITP